MDSSGYLGKFYRQTSQQVPISLNEFSSVFKKENRLVMIMKCIKEIDKDNNGYVTNQELDDIFKLAYPNEF